MIRGMSRGLARIRRAAKIFEAEPLRLVELKDHKFKCCICGRGFRRGDDAIRVGNNMRAHVGCVIKHSFTTLGATNKRELTKPSH